jgi:3-oxoacyl-[acyl-carrier-protein] synthase III
MAAKSDVPPPLRVVHDIKAVAVGAPTAMIEATRRVLDDSHVPPTSVFLVPHQASIGVVSALDATGVPAAQIGISLYDRGNMSTASVPVTLGEHWEQALELPHLVMTSVGVGMSFGAILFERVAPADRLHARFRGSPRDPVEPSLGDGA